MFVGRKKNGKERKRAERSIERKGRQKKERKKITKERTGSAWNPVPEGELTTVHMRSQQVYL